MSETVSDDRTRGPLLLCILDGWGHSERTDNNAIALAGTPVLDRLLATCPNSLMNASEAQVGLPAGQMGNSEVGHMNLGAGRVVTQDLPRINSAIASGEFAPDSESPRAEQLQIFARSLQASGGVCHLLGLLSPGGVHSHQGHLVALARTLCDAGITVRIHGFLDGRDTPPKSALAYVESLLGDLAGAAALATVSGRYFAMDRDRRWDRVQLAYAALVAGQGQPSPDPLSAIEAAYDRGETDEFVQPTVIAGYAGMTDGDGLLSANFRADRARQMLGALVQPSFDGFARQHRVEFAARLAMVSYSNELDRHFATLFPPIELDNTIGELVAANGLKQLRIAETEKYAHVTFFFNGGREQVFDGEDRILVPSPAVATYDQRPEMAADEVTDRLVAAIEDGGYDLIVANYANPDMVGHTGDLKAAITAAETVDACIGRIETALSKCDGAMLLTADHGNCEQMVDPSTGAPHTAHTMNPVPAILVNGPSWVSSLATGKLADVAPTLLQLLGLDVPEDMTGKSLLLARRSGATDPADRAVA